MHARALVPKNTQIHPLRVIINKAGGLAVHMAAQLHSHLHQAAHTTAAAGAARTLRSSSSPLPVACLASQSLGLSKGSRGSTGVLSAP